MDLQCARGLWLVFVGDSQVRNLLRFLARSLGATRRMPESMRPRPASVYNHSDKPPSYYDDWDMETADDASSIRLSFRFAGGDWHKYDRVRRNPHELERYDMNKFKHVPAELPTLVRSQDSRGRRPDLIVFASSLWYPTCDRLREC